MLQPVCQSTCHGSTATSPWAHKAHIETRGATSWHRYRLIKNAPNRTLVIFVCLSVSLFFLFFWCVCLFIYLCVCLCFTCKHVTRLFYQLKREGGQKNIKAKFPAPVTFLFAAGLQFAVSFGCISEHPPPTNKKQNRTSAATSYQHHCLSEWNCASYVIFMNPACQACLHQWIEQ